MSNRKNNTWVEPKNFKPVKIHEVEVSQALQDITNVDDQGHQIYGRGLVLVRLHSYPLGFLELDLDVDHLSATELAVQLWAQYGPQINHHLRQDGLPLATGLPHNGLMPDTQYKCLAERQEILREASLVSIILSTHDRVQSLAATLDSLLALEYPHFEIILVDNAPKTDETRDFFTHNLDRFSLKNISLQYVREETPGLAVAHNRGLEVAGGSIVAFTDDDVVVDKNWLAEIVRGFRVAPSVGCVTGLVIPLELQTPAQVLFEEYGGFTKGFSQQIYDLGAYRPLNPLFPYTAGRFGTGANMAFKTDLLREAGGFDPAMGIGTPTLGADDMAAFFLAIKQGYQLVYQPPALVFHQHRRTYEELRRQMFGYGVGLTAFLTKCILDNPGLIFDITSRIPAGIRYTFDPASAKNKRKSSNYPRFLEKIERQGMLYGPMAYLISRWRYRKARKPFPQEGGAINRFYRKIIRSDGWTDGHQGLKRTKE